MKKKISIAIDAMGGENSPFKNIKGINLFYNKIKIKMIFYLTFFETKKKLAMNLKILFTIRNL